MNKTLMFIQADMHRAINEGRKHMEVSVLDLKEMIAAVASSEARDQKEKSGIIFGFIRPDRLAMMRCGKELYCSIRRKKSDEYNTPVFCNPEDGKTVYAVAQPE
ncbi:hypothetical protein D3C80_944550 [compost metagenome]